AFHLLGQRVRRRPRRAHSVQHRRRELTPDHADQPVAKPSRSSLDHGASLRASPRVLCRPRWVRSARCGRLCAMRTTTVTAPDGYEWKVRAFRVRLPPWRQVDLWGDSQFGGSDYDVFSIVLALITLPFTLVLIPLAIAIVEFPFAV